MFAFEITMDRDKYKELKKEYENEIQQLNLKLAFKNFNNSTLEWQLGEKSRMVEKTQKLLADTEAKNEKLRKTSTVKTKKLQDNRHCLTESEGKIKTLKNENLKLKNKQKQLFQYYESTTIKLLNQNQRVKELEAKVANFEKQIEDKSKKVKKTQKRLLDEENDNQELRIQIFQLKAKLTESEAAQNGMLRLAQAMNISQSEENPPTPKRIRTENTSA